MEEYLWVRIDETKIYANETMCYFAFLITDAEYSSYVCFPFGFFL